MDVVRIPGPGAPPIGLLVARVGKALDKAFDDALAAVGGSRPAWLILLAVKSGAGATQANLARHVGISGPTLIHHLDRLQAAGLVVRTQDPANRRPHTITLTHDGEVHFVRLRESAVTFDRKLREGMSERRIAELRRALTMLSGNIVDSDATAASSTTDRSAASRAGGRASRTKAP